MDFVVWLFGQLPDFLLSPPISGFTAICLLAAIGRLVHRMVHL